jgi:hypothetical protein
MSKFSKKRSTVSDGLHLHSSVDESAAGSDARKKAKTLQADGKFIFSIIYQ